MGELGANACNRQPPVDGTDCSGMQLEAAKTSLFLQLFALG
jgi:hypothetical protein